MNTIIDSKEHINSNEHVPLDGYPVQVEDIEHAVASLDVTLEDARISDIKRISFLLQILHNRIFS